MKFLIFTFLLFSGLRIHAQHSTFTSYFDFDANVLNEQELKKLRNFLELNPDIHIFQLKGFTDPKGGTSYNETLALERIKTILFYLKDEGIEQQVIGENYPRNGKVSHAEMRKVEISYITGHPVNIKNDTIIKESPIKIESPVIVEESRFDELITAEEPVSIDLDVKFIGGEDILLKESLPDLKNFYNFVASHQNIRFLIRGHVCCMNDYNLSVRRAKAIYDYLVDKGIDPSRLEYKGYSNTMPKVSPERTEADRIQNRRVDVLIIK